MRSPPDLFRPDSSESGRNLEQAWSIAASSPDRISCAASSAAGLVTSTEQKVPSALVVRPATDGTAGCPSAIAAVTAAGLSASTKDIGVRLWTGDSGCGETVMLPLCQPLGQPPDFEPLVVVCDGVGLGAGGEGGGLGVGLLEVGLGFG